MGNLDFSANADQLKELAAYMASQINVPTIGIGGGYAPIGAIIPLMGTTAPQDYLACDGTVYNIADYPQLADYFESQFGESNHFGGNGTTTFAVPNLQGEFLRGTGTNSHANQGSGANVGEHQDGTVISGHPANGTPSNIYTFNEDSELFSSGFTLANTSGASNRTGITSRPTNTSVLYCIKAVVAGEVYSTKERVVGTWIDGKPIYQKTLTGNNPLANSTPLILNVDTVINVFGSTLFTSANIWFQYPFATGQKDAMRWELSNNNITYVGIRTDVSKYKWTFQYTKTTDG